MKNQTQILYGGLRALARELGNEQWRDARYTILLDENTFQHCLPLLISMIEPLQGADFIEVPGGEDCKSLDVASQVWQTLLENNADRKDVIVNLGGGCVCDLGGFVAAGYKRGIRHIHVPTTLLSMVDAAIGGKTAINFAGVKNSIGHFYPPSLTIIDPVFLNSLPQKEILNGQIEMIKTAAVADALLYNSLMSNDGLSKSDIVQVARIKNRVVRADPFDHGIRKILNFGHTFGHAVEMYSQMSHGAAVGVGMLAAMYLSMKKIGLDRTIYESYFEWINEKIAIPQYSLRDTESLLSLMRQDKKSMGGKILCVLLKEPGASMIDVELSENEIRDAFLVISRKR